MLRYMHSTANGAPPQPCDSRSAPGFEVQNGLFRTYVFIYIELVVLHVSIMSKSDCKIDPGSPINFKSSANALIEELNSVVNRSSRNMENNNGLSTEP